MGVYMQWKSNLTVIYIYLRDLIPGAILCIQDACYRGNPAMQQAPRNLKAPSLLLALKGLTLILSLSS